MEGSAEPPQQHLGAIAVLDGGDDDQLQKKDAVNDNVGGIPVVVFWAPGTMVVLERSA